MIVAISHDNRNRNSYGTYKSKHEDSKERVDGEADRQTDRDRETERDRGTETERQRETETIFNLKGNTKDTQTDKQRDRDQGRETERKLR